ncbi:hypothetical protein IGI04_029818 [Brassica rapa subsp. trilocularis]|uniref:Uncharacterized protein n=1 Tax=Brassica rapa subsp. trilocularis TaxID=1813537 RepID=A0ABQ7LNW6_BRACM|nr:hypothetical protein IGI04_029818 [Brassica rapa subsp. trilocularis]
MVKEDDTRTGGQAASAAEPDLAVVMTMMTNMSIGNHCFKIMIPKLQEEIYYEPIKTRQDINSQWIE